MAWMLKSIDAGKAHGILTPAAERRLGQILFGNVTGESGSRREEFCILILFSYNKVNKAYQEEE